ncbi:terminase [Bordetella genomosp. 9]|uniref:Terminase n=1 Tax=Bordetella genomosp. 9 TaxID=1416803 RepID=A0A261R667_9BORD|nr:terminase [Bordetella genomosp. 9]OZI20514.1 terminase [Bordetella genomosp. 9]
MARPSSYKPEYAEQARKLCLLGATDKELAGFFGTSEQTINAWKSAHPEFLEALKKGKQQADAEVADRLYQRALGYEHPEVDIRVVSGEIVQTPITKVYPPDTVAAIFWLKNRQKAAWRDKIEHVGNPDEPINMALTIKFKSPGE